MSDRVVLETSPGTGKSTIKVVASSWEIARNPAHRMLHGSHSYELASRDSRRTRRIVESPAFKARFGVQLRSDENTMGYWSSTEGGFYVAAGAGSGVTGHRVNSVVIDDGLSALGAHSKADRDAAYTWLAEGMLTRIDTDTQGRDGRALVVGQRLAASDLAGRLRETGAWTVVTVPAEFDPRRRCFVFARDGRELWRDPREQEGELAAPDVLPAQKLAELRAAIGSAAFNAHYNQAPGSDETSLCPAKWWRFYRSAHATGSQRRPIGCDDAPAVVLPDPFSRTVIASDLTFGATGASADYAVVACWAVSGGGRYLLELFRRRCGFDEQVSAIAGMAERHPGAKVVIEAAANGRAVVETLRKSVAGVLTVKAQGSKAQRLAAIVPAIESGSCYLPESAPWLADLVEEFQTFPGAHDDIVDACGYAIADLGNRVSHDVDAPGALGGPIGDVSTTSSQEYSVLGGEVDVERERYDIDLDLARRP
ncbi:MAG TPA: phage terminase large subunit [Kofleriaceae bacterium]